MGTQFTRRTLLTAAPVLALAFMPESPALPPSGPPQLAVEDNSLLEFFQTLRRMDKAGHARMVEWLRAQDHKIFNALADPVERYCAQLNAADKFADSRKVDEKKNALNTASLDTIHAKLQSGVN